MILKELFQVCFELNEDNKDREINGMLAAMQYTKLKTRTLLTLTQSDELEFNNKTIFVKPVRVWLIE